MDGQGSGCLLCAKAKRLLNFIGTLFRFIAQLLKFIAQLLSFIDKLSRFITQLLIFIDIFILDAQIKTPNNFIIRGLAFKQF